MRLDGQFHCYCMGNEAVGISVLEKDFPTNEDGERIYIFEPSEHSVMEMVIRKLVSKKRVSRVFVGMEGELRSLAVWLDIMNYGKGFDNTEDRTFYNLKFSDIVLHPVLAIFVQPYKITVDGRESSPDLKDYPELFDKDLTVDPKASAFRKSWEYEYRTVMEREAAAWTKDRFQRLADNMCGMLKQDASCLVTMDQLRKIETFTPEAPEKYIFEDTFWHCNAGLQRVPTVIKDMGLWNKKKWMLDMYDGLTDLMNNQF